MDWINVGLWCFACLGAFLWGHWVGWRRGNMCGLRNGEDAAHLKTILLASENKGNK